MSKASDYANAPKPTAPSIDLGQGVGAFVTDNGGLMFRQEEVRIYVDKKLPLALRDWLTATYDEPKP